jgi:hypothetical protein
VTLTRKLWLLWFALAMAGGSALVGAMVYGGPLRSQLLVGKTTNGHHQIELACDTCHKPFGGKEAMQQACASCHGNELKLANDSHPAKKFTDPRNADRLAKLNATLCVTCHREHQPEITGAMGVTLPGDYCYLCHEDIGKDRVSHQGLPFNGCTAAGCHNFHDNRALYEDFLEKHAGEPHIKLPTVLAALKPAPSSGQAAAQPLGIDAADAPADKSGDPSILADWHETAHAKAAVNCKGCHAPKNALGVEAAWTDKPGMQICASCHGGEAKSFVEGKHGMRLKPGMLAGHEGLGGLFQEQPLSPMRPELARLPMSAKAHGADLTCTTCHGSHRFDVVRAQVEGCLTCHADDHSKAYLGSRHHEAWLAELRGEAPKGSGVTCASCHMPRAETEDEFGRKRLTVTHNQNDTLQPNEKMIRPVCLSCHGLQFSLDSLADKGVIASNFTKRPGLRVESIDWVIKRAKQRAAK